MGTLSSALAWAARGFPVFPLRENDKEPAVSNWIDTATTDAETIRQMWIDPVLKTERNYNIGCACNDMVVIDIDVKGDKDGYNEYMQLQGHFDTLVVQTPSGGYHCYFLGPDSSNAPVAKSVDVRSHNGFVVAPGSSINGNLYTVVRDADMAWVPPKIEAMLKPPYVRDERSDEGKEIDTPASIQAGINFLVSAPLAIEGQRGDEVTFITAARLVRELALSPQTAFELMRDYWNDRCDPPWDLDELARKVENASSYGSAELGSVSAEVAFASVNVQPPPSIFDQLGHSWGNAVAPRMIKPRPWIVDRMLMRRAVTILLAAGSAGKSSISLALAAHMALGLPFAGFKVRHACKTVIYNAEDDIEEQSRRLLAVCMTYGLDFDKVTPNLLLLSRAQIKFDLMHHENRKPVRNDILVQQIINQCKAEDVGMLILDPLVKIHQCDENDNVQMDAVMETISMIAEKANVGVLALHHTSKGKATEDRTGNMDIGRGASAIINAARIAFTLMNSTQNDAEQYGFQDSERNLYVRLDDAKMNLALASDQATWFRRESQNLYSGDTVGVMKYEELKKSDQHLRIKVARLLLDTLKTTGSGDMSLASAVATIKTHEPLWANKPETELRRRLEALYSGGFTVDDATLKFVREPSSEMGKEKVRLVML